MSDKPGPGREQERFPAQKEYQKPTEHKESIDTAKAMETLASSIDIAGQMPKNNQEVINTMLQD
ncbi:hypothetical protein GF369_03480, partial [Candidatus Peregrinibacteria bacterium]|nr:hypothetical protein [Candidatus Peregrinibacteria bacterium]